MATKHLFNSSEGLVVNSLGGAVALNPALRLHTASKSVYVHSPSESSHVAVISGGGAGHEPAHASYTGRGMLSAAVSGDIFASPSAKQIVNTISLAAYAGSSSFPYSIQPRDVLVIINNYTGDRLNFGLAIEKARSRGITVESVVVADDVSLLSSEAQIQSSLVGPRGLAGNILVCKLLGAFAERGADLASIKKLGDAVVRHIASIGIGMDHCHVPGRPKEQYAALGEDECEVGLGLHNEAGVRRLPLTNPEKLVEEMIRTIQTSRSQAFVRPEDEIIFFINNLGGISQLEMGAVLKLCLDELGHLGMHPVRIYMSSYMTSLNALGFSISVVNVTAVHDELRLGNGFPGILALLDDPTDSFAWAGVRTSWPASGSRNLTREAVDSDRLLELLNGLSHDSTRTTAGNGNFWRENDLSTETVKRGIMGACHAVLKSRGKLTEYDTVVGDGDCGETFAAGAQGILRALDGNSLDISAMDPAQLVQAIGAILEDSMGGTAGALFAIFFTAWSTSIPQDTSTLKAVTRALNHALISLAKHTPAQPGDRTLVDSLAPFCTTLQKGGLKDAVEAAKEGGERTRTMKPKLGRAVYVGEVETAVPDPGAVGVATIVQGFWEGYAGQSSVEQLDSAVGIY